MLTQERYQLILSLLAEKNAVTVAELTQALGASEATVRRDLNALDEMGRLHKVHGGATGLGGTFVPGEFVYLDAGSSTGAVIDRLVPSRATFVTNGIDHARRLTQRGLKAFILGGQFKSTTEAIVGAMALHSLRQYNFTKCFLGANGVDLAAGFTTPDSEEAMLKSEAMNRAYLSFVLCDHSKFRLVSPITFAPLNKACILTDRLDDEAYRKETVVKVIKEGKAE